MSDKLEKTGSPMPTEVIELEDAMLDLAVGGLDSDLFKDINIITTNVDCPCNPTTNSVVRCGGSSSTSR